MVAGDRLELRQLALKFKEGTDQRKRGMGDYDNTQFFRGNSPRRLVRVTGRRNDHTRSRKLQQERGGEKGGTARSYGETDDSGLVLIYIHLFRVGVDPEENRGRRRAIPNSHLPYVHYATNFTFIYTVPSS